MNSAVPAPDGWTRVRFGDVVSLVRDRVSDITSCGLDKYVRGEDFDPGEPLLRRHSLIGDGMHGPAFHMRFQAGDVLYVSRNPRLRKAVQADFEGICANTTYVCRADGAALLQDLLVFVMQSEAFTAYAKQHQRGSTNFYVNWSDLEPFEFDLPPIEEQSRAVRLLQLNIDVFKHVIGLSKSLDCLRSAHLQAAFAGLEAPTQSVADLAIQVSKGESPGWQGFEYVQCGPMFITSEHVLFGSLSIDECKRIPESFHAKLERSAIKERDVLINLVGASIGRAAIAPGGLGPANTNQAVAVVRFDESRMLPEFFLAWYLSPATQNFIASASVNTARANVSLTDIRQLRVPVPAISDQKRLVAQASLVTSAQRHVAHRESMIMELWQLILPQLAGR